MCIKCHNNMSDVEIQKNLEGTNSSNFDLFNMTSIVHLIFSSSGYNGEENRRLSINLLIKYYNWNINNHKTLISSENLDKIVNYLQNNKITGKNETELLDYISYFKELNIF